MSTLLLWYYKDLVKKDSQQVIPALAAAEKRFADKNYKLLQRQAWLLQQDYITEKKTDGGDQHAIMMLAAADVAAKKNWPLTEAACPTGIYSLVFTHSDGKVVTIKLEKN